jgi:hypothetical protein
LFCALIAQKQSTTKTQLSKALGVYMINIIKNNFTGNEKLWKVFWLHNILGGIALSVLIYPAFLGLAALGIPKLIFILPIILFLWLIWVMFGFWQCAFNCSWRGWGYFSRGYVILVLMSVIFGVLQKFT